MATLSGYIRIEDGTDELIWNEIDDAGVLTELDPFMWWDGVPSQQIFFDNPPSVPVTPDDPYRRTRTNYFLSDRVRVFRSERIRVFKA